MAARLRLAVAGLSLVLILAGVAEAGMPSLTLADVVRTLALSNLTRMRLETISFFLLGLLACSAAIRAVWNGLRADFAFLPRLSYGKAVGLVALWGLLFVLVLTMISGARELMTPGAWEKKGLTYQLVEEAASPVERQNTGRHRAIERLRDALRDFAGGHGGKYPAPEAAGAIPDSTWVVPASGGRRYVYKGGQVPQEDAPFRTGPLAYEPDVFGPDRLVLLTNGTILWMPIDAIERAANGEAR